MRTTAVPFLLSFIFCLVQAKASTTYIDDLSSDSFNRLMAVRPWNNPFELELGGNLFCPGDNKFYYENKGNPGQSFGDFASTHNLRDRLITQTTEGKRSFVIYATEGDKRLGVDWGLMFNYRDSFWLHVKEVQHTIELAFPQLHHEIIVTKFVTLGHVLDACSELSGRKPG